jgi:hypothetical protein
LKNGVNVDIEGHDGIISKLKKTDSDPVEVTASSTYWNKPQDILNYSNTYFGTYDEPNSHIQLKFKSKKIKLTMYFIRTNDKNFSSYSLYCPQNWKVERSNDGQKWDLIDQKSNQSCLIGVSKEVFFHCQSNEFYSFIKFTQTGLNSNGNNSFCLGFIELSGRIKNI